MADQQFTCPVCQVDYFATTAPLHAKCGILDTPEAVEVVAEIIADTVIEPVETKTPAPKKRGPKPKVKEAK